MRTAKNLAVAAACSIIGLFGAVTGVSSVLLPYLALTSLPQVLPEPPPPPEPEEDEAPSVEEEVGEPPFQTLIAHLEKNKERKPFYSARGQGPDRTHAEAEYSYDAPAEIDPYTLRWRNNLTLYSPWSWPQH